MSTVVKLTKKELAEKQEALLVQQRIDSKRMKLYAADTWKTFENWGRESGNLSNHQQNYCFTISGRIRKNLKFEPLEVSNGVKILDVVTEHAPELLIPIEKLLETVEKKYPTLEVNLEVLKQAVLWDKKNKKLKNISYTFLSDLANERKTLTEQNKKIASWNLEILQKYGFEFKPEQVNPES